MGPFELFHLTVVYLWVIPPSAGKYLIVFLSEESWYCCGLSIYALRRELMKCLATIVRYDNHESEHAFLRQNHYCGICFTELAGPDCARFVVCKHVYCKVCAPGGKGCGHRAEGIWAEEKVYGSRDVGAFWLPARRLCFRDV